LKILVADDDRVGRVISQMALRRLGHESDVVSNGIEAWKAFGSDRPDVVMSDWMMPGLSGLELCRKIRAAASADYTYFIMLTGQGGLAGILDGMEAGADDYLQKPLDLNDLQARLIAAARVTALHHDLARQRLELEQANNELTAISRRDPLTGLRNRRALDEDLALLEARVERYGHRYCMALLDVDLFKAYNDRYGHPAGDEVLRIVAEQLEDHARGGDSLYRYGGEEFLCIFPEQSIDAGTVAVERMRAALQDMAIPHMGSPFGVLTISAGMGMFDPGRVRSTSEVLKEADDALYRAKDLGRNRVEQAAAWAV
jgi:diguanylate cyclase (GGDEF)-like protein